MDDPAREQLRLDQGTHTRRRRGFVCPARFRRRVAAPADGRRRRLDALNEHRLTALAKVAGAEGTTLEDVLAAYIRPALELSHDDNGSLFMRVLARAFAEHDDS